MRQVVEENIDALSRAILAEARGEAEQILTDARAKAEGIRKQAQQQAERERRIILDRAKQEADRTRSQAVATAQMKARTRQLEHREKLLNSVFEQAEKELPSVQQWTDYEEIAQNLLREALMQLGANKVRVCGDAKTMQVLGRSFLHAIAKEMNIDIEVGRTLENAVGVIVETEDGHLQFDNTLHTRLERLRNEMRAPVYQILVGETAS